MKNKTMTVGGLIKELQQSDPNLPVRFAYDYGDHWHTEVAGSITQVEERETVYSDYHQMPKLACEGETGSENCLILS